MFSLLAMAGDLGGSIGPGIVGRITQNAVNITVRVTVQGLAGLEKTDGVD